MRREGVCLIHGVSLDLAEANESVHFVEVAADLLHERAELSDVGIDLNAQQLGLCLQAVENAVE